ncbi:MAG: hypothetical protein ACXWTH_12025, partial [Methylosarcina sp.]
QSGEAGMTSEMYHQNQRTNFLRNDTFEVRRYAGQALYEFDISDKMQFSTNVYGNYMFRESIRQANDSSEMNNCSERGEPISAEIAPSCGNEQRPRTYRVFGIEPKLVFTHDLFGVESETTAGIRGHFEWADRERYVGNAGPRDLTRGEGLNNHGRNRYQNNSLDTQALSFFAQKTVFSWAISRSRPAYGSNITNRRIPMKPSALPSRILVLNLCPESAPLITA